MRPAASATRSFTVSLSGVRPICGSSGTTSDAFAKPRWSNTGNAKSMIPPIWRCRNNHASARDQLSTLGHIWMVVGGVAIAQWQIKRSQIQESTTHLLALIILAQVLGQDPAPARRSQRAGDNQVFFWS